MFEYFGDKISDNGIIFFLRNKNLKCRKRSTDTNGRIIIMEAHIDDEIFVLINLYSSNTEKEQMKTLCELDQLLGKSSLDSYKKDILLKTLIYFLTQI